MAEPLYHNIAVPTGGVADRYITKLRETHNESAAQAIQRLIQMVDPKLEFLDEH